LIFLMWTLGVPSLAAGLVATSSPVIAIGGALLLAGVILNALQAYNIATSARRMQR
jgi:hypothetical protein